LMADDNVLRKLNNPTNVEFLDLALNDALQYLGEYHAVTVHRDAEPIQAAKTDLDYPITAKLSGVPLRTVLRLLLEPLRLDFFVDKGELVVTTREVAAGQFSDFRYSIARQLDDVVRAGISPADLGEAIVRTIDPSTWEPAGGQGSLQPEPAWLQIRQRMNVRLHLDDLLRELHDALRDRRVVADEDRHEIKEYPIAHLQELKIKDAAILERLNETILAGQAAANRGRSSATIKGDRLILTQPRWVLAEADSLFGFLTNLYNGAATRDSVRGTFEGNVLLSVEARRRMIRNRLTQTIPVDFVDLPLVDGLIYVNEAGSPINYFVSEETKKAGIKWSSLVNMKADNNSLSTLLDKLLVPFKLDWYIADPDVVVVTTRADAAGRMEPRVYRTKELLAGGQTEKGLMARIAAIEPDSWATLAGPGQMRLLPGVLIVSHNRRTHEQISRLLASLNPGK